MSDVILGQQELGQQELGQQELGQQELGQQVYKILKHLGLSQGKMDMTIIVRQKPNSVCEYCKKQMTPHSVIFSPCRHESCTHCADFLADSYTKDTVDELFICPFCAKVVYNIDYK